MSTENAVKFLSALNSDKSLSSKVLDGAATVKAWITQAASAGYEVTAEELRSVAEQLVGKPLSVDNLVGALRSVLEGELTEDNLEAVVGGVGASLYTTSTLQTRLNHLEKVGFFAKESGPSWSNDPKHFDPGGSRINPGR